MPDPFAEKAIDVLAGLKASPLRKPSMARMPKRFAEGGEAAPPKEEPKEEPKAHDGEFWNNLARWVYTGEGRGEFAGGGEVEASPEVSPVAIPDNGAAQQSNAIS